jgi:glycosyltransferase involved in cell wall biosynthesis
MGAKVCLNMIVKDEAAIIERCLQATDGQIDAWVIFDTGSLDDTPALITAHFAARGIPGQLVHGHFRDFEQARNRALTAARESDLDFDYLLFLDADSELHVDDPSWRERLCDPAYKLRVRNTGMGYDEVRLLRRDHEACYRGVTQEYLDLGELAATELSTVWYVDHADSSGQATRADRDIALLRQALADDPDNPRYVFYLAQAYRDAGDLKTAIDTYTHRAILGGWDEEVWYCHYQIALLSERSGLPEPVVVHAYLTAWQRRPTRAEPLVALARYYREHGGRHALAELFAAAATTIPRPDDTLFVDEATYDWRAEDEYAMAAYWRGRHAESAQACRALLAGPRLPADQRERVNANLRYALNAGGNLED